MTITHQLRRPLLAGVAILVLTLGACNGTASPPVATTDPSASASPAAPGSPGAAEPDPGGSDPSGTQPGGGGGSAGDPGTGVGGGGGGQIDPGAGEPKIVTPLPGRLNPRPVAPTAIRASVDGRHVLVKLIWYGGVEPCSVLDSVKVERSGNDIALTPFEGASDQTAICIEIAMLKATIVDLGELEPGTYRIASPGSEAAPVQITID